MLIHINYCKLVNYFTAQSPGSDSLLLDTHVIGWEPPGCTGT